jgi:hypothetical protein
MNPPCAIPKRFAPWNPWPIPPGLESQGTLTRIWAKHGGRPRIRLTKRGLKSRIHRRAYRNRKLSEMQTLGLSFR